VFRFLVLLLGMLTANGSGQREAARNRVDDLYGGTDAPGGLTNSNLPGNGEPLPSPPAPLRSRRPLADGGADRTGLDRQLGGRSRHRHRIPPRIKWTAVVIAVGLIFRKAIASLVMMALSAGLHIVGINVHLPSIRFAWPWQTISTGTTTNADLGPWVLQKIEGISKPALGEANFTFFFTHKVSKSIGPWPCWYASTFYAVGHASATVDLNPGPAWWTPTAGHYRLQVLSRPRAGKPGHVTVMMVFPRPQLPQSVHDVTIDNLPSRPISTQHSWTYPGFGCGAVLRPQFPESVLYSQAQQIAFYRSNHTPQVVQPLISSAETQAAQTVRDNFIQPTVNAFGYKLDQFIIRWTAAP
jgi:hypothetical protein